MHKRSAARAQLGHIDLVAESVVNDESIDIGGTVFYTPRSSGWRNFHRFGGFDLDIRLGFVTLQLTATYREKSHDRGRKYMVHA